MGERGPAPHKPTDKLRERVKTLKCLGTSDEVIASCLDMSVESLLKHYGKEVKEALLEANSKVSKSLFNKAIACDDSASVSAAIFWLKTRARWRTADNESLLESNDKLREELMQLRAKLDEKNKKDY